MDIFDAVSKRRSIRSFKDKRVPRELVERILSAAVLAPSAKNHQPWRFVVLEGKARLKLADLMCEGAAYMKSRGEGTGSCENSARIVREAPLTVVIFNPLYEHDGLIFDHVTYNAPDIQSIGAMIQNMLLAAEALGLGTLWIADVLYAYQMIREWLGRRQELVAAVSIGWADESPQPRPRTPWNQITEWRADE
jgi:nitroreductase